MRAKLFIPPSFELPNVWLAGIGKVRLGVHLKDGWCIDIAGRTRALSEPEDVMPLLPLLEMSRAQFYEHVRHLAHTTPELAKATQSFPDVLLLRFAFESSVSDYWPHKALDWLDTDTALDPQIGDSLRALLGRPWATERLKQRAEQALKRAAKKTFKRLESEAKEGGSTP
jgi:hypothetical protein